MIGASDNLRNPKDCAAVCPVRLQHHQFHELLDHRLKNEVLNTRIDEEVGVDDGRFLPIKFGFWRPTVV